MEGHASSNRVAGACNNNQLGQLLVPPSLFSAMLIYALAACLAAAMKMEIERVYATVRFHSRDITDDQCVVL